MKKTKFKDSWYVGDDQLKGMIQWDSEWNEYRTTCWYASREDYLAIEAEKEDSAYYSDDFQDSKNTLEYMVNSYARELTGINLNILVGE